MSWRLNYQIGMSEQGANSILPAGGAGGLALGAWALNRGGMSAAHIGRRSVAFFRDGNYDALMIAGGRAPEYLRLNDRVIEVVKAFAKAEKPIAGICHAAQLLAAAEVIKGKKIAGYAACAPEIRLAGATYVDTAPDKAITDGNFVTGFAWSAHIPWLAQFLKVLGTKIEL